MRSARCGAWLRRLYYEATGAAPRAPELRSALDLLEARAQFDAPERAVHVRVAEHAGRIYLDLADRAWRAVEIGPDGWQVIGSPPVRFRRPAGMLPLPLPQRGGSLEHLARCSICRAETTSSWWSRGCWRALRPGGPYPLLAVAGEQGSAKTVLSKMLRGARSTPTPPRCARSPREERELFIAANQSAMCSPSTIFPALPRWLSDALCRLASGGSLAVRQLYTDEDEVLFRGRASDHSQRHRGCRHPARPRRPRASS